MVTVEVGALSASNWGRDIPLITHGIKYLSIGQRSST